MEDIEKYVGNIEHLIVLYGVSILEAVVVLILGLWIIRRVMRFFTKVLNRRKVDPSLRPFLISIISVILKIMLIISVASMVGVEMTSFVAVLGAAGLAVGLALQGSLSNFAGGVLILLLKPFRAGDFIEGAGYSGTVREIQIFYTYLTTVQNQEVIIPNAQLSNDPIKNYSFHNTRRMDVTFGIGYSDDIDKAKKILEDIVTSDERLLKEPEHLIFVEALADSSVNIHVRAWTSNSEFWNVYNEFPEKVKKAFDKEGVNIPFPQMDVHFFPNQPEKQSS